MFYKQNTKKANTETVIFHLQNGFVDETYPPEGYVAPVAQRLYPTKGPTLA